MLLAMRLARDAKKEICAVSSGTDIFQYLPDHGKDFIAKRVKERIPIRWIAPESHVSRELNATSKSEYRRMKFFDAKKYRFTVEIDIYADSVALIAFGRHPNGVIIENKELAASLRGLFNLLWDSLR